MVAAGAAGMCLAGQGSIVGLDETLELPVYGALSRQVAGSVLRGTVEGEYT